MKTRVIVLGVSRYSFPDKNSGEIIEGAKVNYVEERPADEENVVGHTPQTANVKYKEFDELYAQGVPGVYDAHMRVDMTGRQPKLKIDAFEFVEPFSLLMVKPITTKAV